MQRRADEGTWNQVEKSEGMWWTGRERPEDVKIWLNVTFHVSSDFKLHRGSKL